MFHKRIITTRGRLAVVLGVIAAIAFAPSAFGAKQSSMDMVRSALHISKRADSNATKALKPVDSKRIKDGAVAAVDIANAAVGNAQLGDNSVTSNKIADGQVTGADLAGDSVDGSKVADNSLGG